MARFYRAGLLFAFVACSSTRITTAPPLVVDDGCQPILAGTSHDDVSRGGCLLPYPSDFWRVEAPAPHILLAKAARPRPLAGETAADIHEIVPMDGFSLVPTIVATLPSDVGGDGLPNVLDDPNASATSASATVIVDAETGAFVPHYTDKIDRGIDALHQPIVLRPFVVLAPKHRYIVAIHGARLADGSGLAPPPEGFRRLRDRIDDPALASLRQPFDDRIFSVLERSGVSRAGLQLAWDFTTGSEEEPRAAMLRIRELTLAWLATNPPHPVVTNVAQGTGKTWLTIDGLLETPLYLENADPGARLVRDAAGSPRQNGTVMVPFRMKVPAVLKDRATPGRALAYGHGFFGSRDELDSASAATIGERLGAVEFGIDWWGMSKADVGDVANTLGTTPEHGGDFAERVHQAIANWLVLTAAVRGPLALLVGRPLGDPNAGAPLYDPTFISYFGASQGHILGGTLAAIDPNVSRAVLNVGGGAFTHIMPRSGNFGPFSLVLDTTFGDALVSQAYIAMFQRVLDRIDPITYAPLVERSPLPGSPSRRVLLQTGIGDPAIPNVCSFLHARALGISETMPAPASIFGLPSATDPSASALTLFDYGIDTSGWRLPQPLPQNLVHDSLRVNPAALAEMDGFLRPDGKIVHPCDGPCDPE